jgi:hypothetical protein
MTELLRDERGAVTTEGVIVAFFFAIVFGLLMHEVRLYRASRAITTETIADIDAEALRPARGGPPDLRRVELFEPPRPDVERWVPLRAPLIDTLDVSRVPARRTGSVTAPAYVGRRTIDLEYEDARMRDELPRGGAGGNWDAMHDTWCRVEMCAGPYAPGPRPWDTE